MSVFFLQSTCVTRLWFEKASRKWYNNCIYALPKHICNCYIVRLGNIKFDFILEIRYCSLGSKRLSSVHCFRPHRYSPKTSHLWQCDVSADRSLRRCTVNDIKRPGIQPQPIHMQMASLALTLINSLWVYSFPVNKDLAAFEWSRTLSGERQKERGLVADVTVKPPQDIMHSSMLWA